MLSIYIDQPIASLTSNFYSIYKLVIEICELSEMLFVQCPMFYLVWCTMNLIVSLNHLLQIQNAIIH